MIVKAVTLAALIAASSGVHADFKYKGPKRSIYDSQLSFEQEEVSPDAFAQNLPLNISLEMLIGDATRLDIGVDVEEDELVTWRGGRPRGEILSEVFAKLDASYSYDNGTFYVRSTREVEAARELGISLKNGVPTQQVLWEIAAPTSVKKLFENWTQKAGYQLRWELDNQRDCLITVSDTIPGKFTDAVKTIIEVSNSQGGCRIPYGRLAGNKVLIIDELIQGQLQ